MNAQSLGAAQGFAPSTSAQKLRYPAAAAFLLIVSLFIIRFARRLRRGWTPRGQTAAAPPAQYDRRTGAGGVQ